MCLRVRLFFFFGGIVCDRASACELLARGVRSAKRKQQKKRGRRDVQPRLHALAKPDSTTAPIEKKVCKDSTFSNLYMLPSSVLFQAHWEKYRWLRHLPRPLFYTALLTIYEHEIILIICLFKKYYTHELHRS
jgi:hypothetical protein